jgi:uncharacterized protein YndB with AHSA1/START domain
MSEPATETLSVVVERDLPFPPDKIWRALTQPHLMAEWLMQSDFQPVVGSRFEFRQDWGAIACEVLEIEAGRRLTYSWAAMGVDTVVVWTLTPTSAGAHLRLEQSGFRRDQRQAYGGAMGGWRRFLDALEQTLAKLG